MSKLTQFTKWAYLYSIISLLMPLIIAISFLLFSNSIGNNMLNLSIFIMPVINALLIILCIVDVSYNKENWRYILRNAILLLIGAILPIIIFLLLWMFASGEIVENTV